MVDLPITKWIKKKIRRLIAIVEDTDTAVHSIASGKYVVWKGDLCKSTAPIAVGGSLSLSNLSPVSDGGLNELSEHLTPVALTYTPASGINYSFAYAYRIGKMVYINVRIRNATISDRGTVVGTISLPGPIAYSDGVEGVAVTYDGYLTPNGYLNVHITQSGDVKLYKATAGSISFAGFSLSFVLE